MRISNMTSPNSGRPVANQYIVTEKGGIMGNFTSRETFQSYDSVIAVVTTWDAPAVKERKTEVVLDEDTWNYSATTAKYRRIFLNEGVDETRAKIKSGEYKLANLNR